MTMSPSALGWWEGNRAVANPGIAPRPGADGSFQTGNSAPSLPVPAGSGEIAHLNYLSVVLRVKA